MATTLAFVLPVIALTMGGSVDYGRSMDIRRDLQLALDNAVLSSFGASTTPNNTLAGTLFTQNFSRTGITVTGPTFTNPDASSISGTVTATVNTQYLGLVGLGNFQVTATSKASAYRQTGVATVTATITNAQGAYDKQVYLFTKDKSGNVTSSTLLLDYDYYYPGYGPSGTKTLTPASGASKTISISPYESYGYYMVIYEDLTYTGRRSGTNVTTKTLWSDAANASTFRRSTGDCTTTTGQTDNWEDGGDTNFVDIVSNLKCTTGANGPLQVRLAQ